MKRVVIWGAALAIIVGLAGAAVAAPAAAPEAVKVGIVDMSRVAGEYRQMQEWNQQFQEFQRKQEEQLQDRHTTRLLTDAERQEYTDLAAMGAPTDANKKRLQELRQLSTTREQRLNELRPKTDRTAAEEAEFKQWSSLYDLRMTELAGLQAELQSAREAEYERLSKQVADSVNDAVKAVAESQKLTIVLKKDAVMLGGTDITDAVLAKLNGPAASKPAG